MINCPLCAEPMTHETRDGVTLDACATHGVWLDRSELLTLTEAARHRDNAPFWARLFRKVVQPPVDPTRTLSCPHCQETMGVERYHEVHIDRCEKHGIWLDAGEMEAIENNLRLDPMFMRGMALRLSEGRY